MKAFPGESGVVRYEEGLLVGYRWFDTKGIEPLFEFGHGLSYTTFGYSGLALAAGEEGAVTVACDIENTGGRDGAEVIQLYVHQENPGLPRPEKELKAFKRVMLKSGEKKRVELVLERSAFAYYDPKKAGWVAEKGKYTVMVGSSSRDIRVKGDFVRETTTVEK